MDEEILLGGIGIVVLVLSIMIGIDLFQGGREIENKKIENAGLYWLIINAIFITLLLIMLLSY